jgi:hypothetical protein
MSLEAFCYLSLSLTWVGLIGLLILSAWILAEGVKQ